MAFNQTPGRQSFSKTGHGIPSPLMQKNKLTGAQTKAIEDLSDNNKMRVALEASSKTDSVSAYDMNKMQGHTSKYSAKMGNKAANETRTKGGAPDMNVYKNTTNPGSKNMDTSAGGDTYFRKGPVEKEYPRVIGR
jgi:hypothetical protein